MTKLDKPMTQQERRSWVDKWLKSSGVDPKKYPKLTREFKKIFLQTAKP